MLRTQMLTEACAISEALGESFQWLGGYVAVILASGVL